MARSVLIPSAVRPLPQSSDSAPAIRIPLFNLKAQYETIRAEVHDAISRVLEEQRLILGPQVERLETAVAERVGARFAIGCASGTDALLLALLALEIGPGDEVITTAMSFMATADVIARVGATPVFADIDPQRYTLDPGEVARRITSRTKAIIPVHLYGQPAEMAPILTLTRRRKIAVIEDAAQAFGAEYRGRPVGQWGTLGCFSFYPTKNLGSCGDGGMVVTSNRRLAQRIRMLRSHGSRKRFHHDVIGLNSRCDELQAAILLVKLRHVDQWNRRRQEIARAYTQALRVVDRLITPWQAPDAAHVFHLYTVQTPRREVLRARLRQQGIEAGVYYPVPLHRQPCFRRLRYRRGSLPVVERLARENLTLPMYPEITEAEVDEVTDAVAAFFNGKGG